MANPGFSGADGPNPKAYGESPSILANFPGHKKVTDLQNTVLDLKVRVTCTPSGPKFLIFMHFLGEICQIISWPP